jgi:hypothetical protein
MDTYTTNKNEIIRKIVGLKEAIEKKPRKKRESKKPKPPTLSISHETVIMKFD